MTRRWRLAAAIPGGVGAAFIVPLLALLVPLFAVAGLTRHTSCVQKGTCLSTSGASTPSWSPEANAVTTTWLPLEERAVAYYCARSDGRPCVPLAFVEATTLQESGGNPLAVSSAGALGLMQVEPSHFRPGQNPFDPLTNIMVGVGFLDRLDAMFGGNLPLVAAAYNAGPAAVAEWLSMFDVANWPALSAEPEVQAWGEGQTVAYVTFVLADYERLKGPKASWLTPTYLPRLAAVEGGG